MRGGFIVADQTIEYLRDFVEKRNEHRILIWAERLEFELMLYWWDCAQMRFLVSSAARNWELELPRSVEIVDYWKTLRRITARRKLDRESAQ